MRLLLSFVLTLGCLFVLAEDCTPGHGLDMSELQALDIDALTALGVGRSIPEELQVGDIRFIRQNVFPNTGHWLARQANRFHVVTREPALESAFILAPGDRIDETVRAEAERNLRGKPYLRGALVLVRRRCGASVDLDVVTRDAWTLTPGVGVSRSGGDNEFSLSLSDLNIAGTGKSVSVEYVDDRDRAGTTVQFVDPNINGTRWTGSIELADNDDGEAYGLTVSRPFYSLDTPWSLRFSARRAERQQDLEFLGDDVFELNGEIDTTDAFVAHSSGRQSGWVRRWYAGFRYVDEVFRFPGDFPGPANTTNRFSFPYVGWALIEDDFVTRQNIERVGVIEDIKLGWSSYVEAGWSTDTLGGQGDHLMLRGSFDFRRLIDTRHLFTLSGEASGRYDVDDQRTEDLVVRADAEFLWHQAERWRLLARTRYVHTRGLSPDRQLTLGGDSGLRGYPSRYQPGDRSLSLTLEQRYYANVYPFGLFRLGYAAFVDVGRAWFADSTPNWLPTRRGKHFDVLANVGIGLRLESTRTRRDRVFHIDIAHPLVDGPNVETWEVTLSGKQRF